MSTCPTQDPRHADCPNCGECLLIGRYTDFRVERTDAAGFPEYDRETGELLYITVPVPHHVLPLWHSRPATAEERASGQYARGPLPRLTA